MSTYTTSAVQVSDAIGVDVGAPCSARLLASSSPERLPKVLVVDDEPFVRRMITRVLRAAGYEVLEAEDGVAGLALALEHGASLDAVLTDAIMPRMSGGELARALAEKGLTLPVLFMSGLGERADDAAGLPAGARVLAKPFQPSALRDALDDVMLQACFAAR